MISQVLLARDMFVYFSLLEGPVSVFAALEGARSKRCRDGSPSLQCLEALSKLQVLGVHLHHLHPRCLDWDLELEDPADDSYPDQGLDEELEG